MRDNYTHEYTATSFNSSVVTLHVGDPIEVVVTASDPEGAELQFVLEFAASSKAPVRDEGQRGTKANLSLNVERAHIGGLQQFSAHIRSPREDHAEGYWDHSVN